jgi:hypothetical protein
MGMGTKTEKSALEQCGVATPDQNIQRMTGRHIRVLGLRVIEN